VKKIYPLLVLIPIFVGLCGCRREQELSRLEIPRRLTIKQENTRGRLVAPAFENAVNGLCPDGELQEYIGGVGARIVNAVPDRHPREFDFSFAAVNSREANAYVLPGGKIFFSRGLLERIRTEDELAAVIALEVAHVTLRHCGTGRMPRLKEAVALRAFEFTPEQEADAAEWGVFYLFRTGYYNPYALADAMRILDALPAWQKTHPSGNRAAGDIELLVRERYPDSPERRGGRREFPASVERLQKKARFYYGIFEDGENLQRSAAEHIKAGQTEEAESELRLSLVYCNNALAVAQEAGDLPAFFPARRGLVNAALAGITGKDEYVKAARADFDRAKQIDPHCYPARLHRGKYFLEIDKFYGPAEEELKAAMMLNPGGEGCGLPWYYMAKLFDDPDNPGRSEEKAVEYYKEYLSLEPEGAHADEVRNRLGR